jgi:hypothetical protein
MQLAEVREVKVARGREVMVEGQPQEPFAQDYRCEPPAPGQELFLNSKYKFTTQVLFSILKTTHLFQSNWENISTRWCNGGSAYLGGLQGCTVTLW